MAHPAGYNPDLTPEENAAYDQEVRRRMALERLHPVGFHDQDVRSSASTTQPQGNSQEGSHPGSRGVSTTPSSTVTAQVDRDTTASTPGTNANKRTA